MLKWHLLSEVLHCSQKMVDLRSSCGAVQDARLQCLEALKLAIKLQALSQYVATCTYYLFSRVQEMCLYIHTDIIPGYQCVDSKHSIPHIIDNMLRSLFRCAELLVVKAELELMQGDREESGFDLDKVRNILELCTGHLKAQLYVSMC